MTTLTEKFHQRRWWALIGLGMALVLLNLDLTVVNLALPVLGQRFHASLSLLQWVNNIYSLTFAALVALTGKIADRYGHRRMYLYGVTFFFLGSLVAGFAPNVAGLIIGRFLQGVGMAGTFGMVFILASAAFPPEKRSYAVGLLVVFVGVAQALGPTAGGFIIEHWGWRYAFLINLPFCILSFILVRFACRLDELKPGNKIHYYSAFLFLAAYFILVTAFNEVQHWGVASFSFLGMLVLGLVVFVATLFWQKKLTMPYFDLVLFKDRVYRTVSLVRPLFQFNFGAFFFVLPLYLQNIIGMTPGMTGLTMLIMTIPLAISSAITGKLNGHLPFEKSLKLAHVIAIIGYVIFAVTAITPIHWWLFSIGLICIGVNVGMMYSTTNFVIINCLPADKKGVGYGFFSANAYFFYSIGVAVAGYLLSTIGLSHFNQLLTHSSLSHHTFAITPYLNGARPITGLAKLYPAGSQALVGLATAAFAKGFSLIMWLFAIFSLTGLLLIGRKKFS